MDANEGLDMCDGAPLSTRQLCGSAHLQECARALLSQRRSPVFMALHDLVGVFTGTFLQMTPSNTPRLTIVLVTHVSPEGLFLSVYPFNFDCLCRAWPTICGECALSWTLRSRRRESLLCRGGFGLPRCKRPQVRPMHLLQ